MTESHDIADQLAEQVRAAADSGTALRIEGSGSKAFYGRETEGGERLDPRGHSGIVSYNPTELVVTARAGTRLAELEAALDDQSQALSCEVPHFGPDATLGGAVAAGLSGPRRPFGGSVRDLVLGTRIINGRGEQLRFGGEVMKNVAGYDVSRLMTGSLGTLGVILEVSLKVLPKPAEEITLVQEADSTAALADFAEWTRHPLPISALTVLDDKRYVRLSGASAGVTDAKAKIGGEAMDGREFWATLREQSHHFFLSDGPLWRLALPPAARTPDLPGEWCIEWSGAQRWLKSDAPAEDIRAAVAKLGGHATLFRGGDRSCEVFHPLDPVRARLQRNIKAAFDPKGIFNPGRIYSAF